MPKKSRRLRVAFVSSKKVGNAVLRNKSRRKLKGVFLEYENKIATGDYIFVAKKGLHKIDYKHLQKDFRFAMGRMKLLNE